MKKAILITILVILSYPVFALYEKADILKIDQNQFVNDTSNELRNGIVSKTIDILYYSTTIRATISAEKSKPDGIYIWFGKGSDSADIVSFLSDTISYYYAKAIAMQSSQPDPS